MPDVEDLDDTTLINLWNAVDDPGDLSQYEQEVITEMARREIDF